MLAVTTAGACTGDLFDRVPHRPGANNGGPSGPNGEEGPGGGSTPGGGYFGTCAAGDELPAAAPMRRLTQREYVNTLTDLFEGTRVPDVTLPGATQRGRFDTHAADQVVSPLLVERALANAETVAERVVADRAWMDCGERDAVTCATEELPELYSRGFRRPLGTAELATVLSFYEDNRAEFGADDALRMSIEALLVSPDFFYRPEVGGGSGAPDGYTALSDHELATRLSYLIWGTMPDDALRRAADAGQLTGDPAALEAEVRRMADDPRARASTEAFFAQWLELSRLEVAHSSNIPEFDAAMRRDLHASVLRFADDAFWDEDSFEALMTGTFGYVNDRTATAFGVPAPGTDELTRVELDPSERAGILTQPGWLASGTHGAAHSPILRGLFVVRSVLCDTIDAPPADVTTELPEDIPEDVLTTRQAVEETHGTEACASCHARIDGAGFAFESYDGIGRFRTTENGVPVDPSAEIQGAGDANGEYPDALSMIDSLSGSERVRECMVRQLYRFGTGRHDEPGDQCQVESLSERLAETDSPIDLLVALATSPSFRFRPEVSE